MPSPFLYSTNPWFALEVSRRYRNGETYAWCSEYFSSADQAIGTAASLIAASSDPKTIYEQLAHAIDTDDAHDARIRGYKSTFRKLAANWLVEGSISQSSCDEIKASCRSQSFRIWRPVLYIIPRYRVEARLQEVPLRKRAGQGMEYILPSLDLGEIDVIELPRLGRR
jgi:hypothetical protein